MVVYDTPIADDDEEFDDETNIPADALTLRDVLVMDYAEQILHADPGSWQIEFDYLAACGPEGKARLGAVLSRLAVDVEDDNSVDRSKEIGGLLDTQEDRMDEEAIDEEKSLARLTGMQRVQKLVEVCKDYALWEEMETLCKVGTQKCQRPANNSNAFTPGCSTSSHPTQTLRRRHSLFDLR